MERLARVYEFWRERRSVPLSTAEDLRMACKFPTPGDLFKTNLLLDKAKDHFGFEPVKGWGTRNRDWVNLERFYSKYNGEYVPSAERLYPGSVRARLENGQIVEAMKPGRPLIDFVRAHLMSTTDGWRHPTKEFADELESTVGIGERLVTGPMAVTVKEINLNESDPIKISCFIDWVEEQIRQDQSPFNGISFNTQDISISATDLPDLLDACKAQPAVFRTKKPSLNASTTKKILARIKLGDGLSWCGMLRADVVLDKSKNEFVFSFNTLHPLLLDFLENKLPVLYGEGVVQKLMDLEWTFKNLYATPFSHPRAVDLQAMALLAGWKFIKSDLCTLYLIACGRLMFADSSCGEQTWGKEWKHLGKYFQIYSLGDIQAGYVVFNVFMTILLLDLIPDANSLCFCLASKQSDAVEFFGDLICHLLTNSSIRQNRSNTDRSTLINAILPQSTRTFYTMGKPVTELELMKSFVGRKPHFLVGGMRYLQCCSFFNLIQAQTLDAIGLVPSKIHQATKKVDPDVLTYGCNAGELTYPAVQTESLSSLLGHPDFEDRVMGMFHEGKWAVTLEEIKHAARGGLKTSILEFFRLNTHRIPEYFKHLKSLPELKLGWWKERATLYRQIHHIYVNTNDGLPVLVGLRIDANPSRKSQAQVFPSANAAVQPDRSSRTAVKQQLLSDNGKVVLSKRQAKRKLQRQKAWQKRQTLPDIRVEPFFGGNRRVIFCDPPTQPEELEMEVVNESAPWEEEVEVQDDFCLPDFSKPPPPIPSHALRRPCQPICDKPALPVHSQPPPAQPASFQPPAQPSVQSQLPLAQPVPTLASDIYVPGPEMVRFRVPIRSSDWEIVWYLDNTYLFRDIISGDYEEAPPQILVGRRDVRRMMFSWELAASYL